MFCLPFLRMAGASPAWQKWSARKACQKHVDAVLDLDDGSHFDTEDQTIIEGLWEEFYDLQSMVQHQATGHYYYAE
jgi:hypothetical protein